MIRTEIMEPRQSYSNGYNLNKSSNNNNSSSNNNDSLSRKRHSYSTLFNLDSIRNFNLPRDDDSDGGVNYPSSSPDHSAGDKAYGAEHANGYWHGRSSEPRPDSKLKRKRSHVDTGMGYNVSAYREEDSNDEDDGISEGYYRNMLGEHLVGKYYKKTRLREEQGQTPGLGTNALMDNAYSKSGSNNKARKFAPESSPAMNERNIVPKVEVRSSELHPTADDSITRRNDEKVDSFTSGYLDVSDRVSYKIPPFYDKLAPLLNLPSFFELEIEESFLIDRLDLKTLSKLVPSVKHNEHHNRDGVVEPIAEFNSLQEKLKALKASNAGEVFKLQVLESDLLLMQQEAMGTKRLIMSETGTLQYCYVKVLEKGDGYEIIERKLPRKTPIKKDPLVVEKEDIEKVAKVWNNIIKRDLQKHYKTFLSHARKQTVDAKKIADFCQKEVKSRTTRSLKLVKVAAIRTKRLTKDMLVFWKRIDKEQSEIRKREEKEAAEALKRQEELREQKRHQQRLNFLISQTELYSHFMQNKTQETTDPSAEDTVGPADEENEQNIEKEKLARKEEEDEEEAALKEEALRNAKKAVSEQKKITSEFDNDCLKFRIGSGDDIPEGSKNMDLHNPSSMPITSSVQQPSLFEGTLKEYQLKGLQWLVNCYEQGLNGILADEMGLGKTIQAVSFLAHLAEEKNIWGPFLIVAPSSVLNNWVDEFKKFCPDLRPLPYWGKNSERAVLRKSIHRKNMYRRESKYHIVVTSYQLIVQDEKCFKRVKWQYMILDEAQAIKSSMSIRWKTLLAFNCRNRLLLTGTPIQNNMAELWALLHFIMPTLFDSHEQFNEWFSKGIENHAEHGGTLNEHQLNRLHAILKPFMLRRLKKDVIAEMCSKKEVTVDCTLSSRQQAFYRAIKNKISVAELININDKKVANLMNIVIQLRKVCNHPELFERNEGRTFMYFCKMTNQLLPPPFGALEDVHYAGGGNPILYKIPKLVYRESILDLPNSRSMFDQGIRQKWLNNVLNIFSPNNIHRSIFPPQADSEERFPVKSGTFGFSRLIDLSPAELSFLANRQILERLLYSLVRWNCQFLENIVDNFLKSEQDDIYQDQIEEEKVRAVTRMLMLPTRSDLNLLRRKLATGPRDMPFEGLVVSHHDRFLNNIKSLKAIYSFIPPTRAPPIDAICSDRGFAYQQLETFENPWLKRLLVGHARTSEFNGPSKPKDPHPLIQEIDSSLPAEQPVLKLTNRIFGSSPPLQTFDLAKMLTDSGKLHTLDALLKRLRAENHRVLLFAQMTKMLNILEDYMNYRKYRYRRLDGSSSVAERRETVKDFQEREDIFVFLLSTRAGGIGINLTAADTVIFYESDWNPTLDLQAMDRAHRLGQTKEVTVYRLICKETIEEKILLRASQKNTVQQLVMTGGQADGNVAADVYSAEDVRSLLLDDPELEQKLKEQGSFQAKDKQRKRLGGRALRLNEDGDMFLAADDEGALLNNLPQNNVNKKRKHNSEAAPASSKRSKKNPKKVTNKKGTSEPQPEMF